MQFTVLAGFATLAGIPISSTGLAALKATDQLRYVAAPVLVESGLFGGGLSLAQAMCSDVPTQEEIEDECED